MDFVFVFNNFRNNNRILESLEEHELKAYLASNLEYSQFFKDAQSHRRPDRKHGGMDVYERMNNFLEYDFPNDDTIRFKDDNEFYRFREYLTEGNRQYNLKIVAKLTKEMKAKKAVENYNIYNQERQKSCKFKCESCDPPIYTNSSSVWEAHICTRAHIQNVNGDPRLYTCDACGEEFENTKKRDKHVDALKCFQLRTCSDCGVVLSAKQKYQEHFIQGICNVKLKAFMANTNLNKIMNQN